MTATGWLTQEQDSVKQRHYQNKPSNTAWHELTSKGVREGRRVGERIAGWSLGVGVCAATGTCSVWVEALWTLGSCVCLSLLMARPSSESLISACF